jgi:hypothetical protein
MLGLLTGRRASRTGRGNGGRRAASTRAAADPYPPEEQAALGMAAEPEEREDWEVVETVEADSDVDIPQGDPEDSDDPRSDTEWEATQELANERAEELRRAEEALRRADAERSEAQQMLAVAHQQIGTEEGVIEGAVRRMRRTPPAVPVPRSRTAAQSKELKRAMEQHRIFNITGSMLRQYQDEDCHLRNELTDIEERFPAPKTTENWRQIHYEQMRMIERSSSRLQQMRDREAEKSAETERQECTTAVPLPPVQPTRQSPRTTRATRTDTPRTPSPTRGRTSDPDDIEITPISVRPEPRTACGGVVRETAAEEMTRRSLMAQQASVAEVTRLMEEIDNIIEDDDHQPSWIPPSLHELRIIDPVYLMGPKVKLLSQPAFDDPAFASINHDNERIRDYNRRRLLKIDRIDKQELLRIFISAKITPGGVCALQRNGFYTAKDLAVIGYESLVDTIKAYNKDRTTPFEDRIPACALTKLHAFTKWAKEQEAHGVPLKVEVYRVNNLKAHYLHKLQATETSRLDKSKDADTVSKTAHVLGESRVVHLEISS